jgi:predicted  nucleic acid-binding Zn-ribbon protein
MSDWFQKADAKKLICTLFTCLVLLGGALYAKDQSMLEDRDMSISKEIEKISLIVQEIRKDQLTNKDHFNDKIESEVAVLNNKIEAVSERCNTIEKDMIKLTGVIKEWQRAPITK